MAGFTDFCQMDRQFPGKRRQGTDSILGTKREFRQAAMKPRHNWWAKKEQEQEQGTAIVQNKWTKPGFVLEWFSQILTWGLQAKPSMIDAEEWVYQSKPPRVQEFSKACNIQKNFLAKEEKFFDS